MQSVFVTGAATGIGAGLVGILSRERLAGVRRLPAIHTSQQVENIWARVFRIKPQPQPR